MMDQFTYRTRGVCSSSIDIAIENGVIQSVQYHGGCSGNTQAIARLAVGMNIDDIIERLQGIVCRSGTSCPDQLAKALIDYKKRRDSATEE